MINPMIKMLREKLLKMFKKRTRTHTQPASYFEIRCAKRFLVHFILKIRLYKVEVNMIYSQLN